MGCHLHARRLALNAKLPIIPIVDMQKAACGARQGNLQNSTALHLALRVLQGHILAIRVRVVLCAALDHLRIMPALRCANSAILELLPLASGPFLAMYVNSANTKTRPEGHHA